MLAVLDGTFYLERVAVHKPANVRIAKKAIKKAFQAQIDKKGFSMVEVISMCPVGWGVSCEESIKWIEDNVIKFYPLGVLKENK